MRFLFRANAGYIETSAQIMWIQIVFLPSGKAQTTVDQNKVTHGW